MECSNYFCKKQKADDRMKNLEIKKWTENSTCLWYFFQKKKKTKRSFKWYLMTCQTAFCQWRNKRFSRVISSHPRPPLQFCFGDLTNKRKAPSSSQARHKVTPLNTQKNGNRAKNEWSNQLRPLAHFWSWMWRHSCSESKQTNQKAQKHIIDIAWTFKAVGSGGFRHCKGLSDGEIDAWTKQLD